MNKPDLSGAVRKRRTGTAKIFTLLLLLYLITAKAHGFVMSVYVWPVEIGIALSVPVVGWILNAIGYVPNAPVTADILNGLQNLVLLFPGLLCLLATVLCILHPLNDKKMASIDAELAKRKERGEEEI